jgi:hypothetical protein
VLLVIITTGFLRQPAWSRSIHLWLSHALLIGEWLILPPVIGITWARIRGRVRVAVASTLGFLGLLGALLLASITGYLGPSNGPYDLLALRRFQFLHYGVMPLLVMAIVGWWYASLAPERRPTAPEIVV